MASSFGSAKIGGTSTSEATASDPTVEIICEGNIHLFPRQLTAMLTGSLSQTVTLDYVPTPGDREWNATVTIGCGLDLWVQVFVSLECTCSFVVELRPVGAIHPVCLGTGPSQPFPFQTLEPIYLDSGTTEWSGPKPTGSPCDNCDYDYPDTFRLEVMT